MAIWSSQYKAIHISIAPSPLSTFLAGVLRTEQLTIASAVRDLGEGLLPLLLILVETLSTLPPQLALRDEVLDQRALRLDVGFGDVALLGALDPALADEKVRVCLVSFERCRELGKGREGKEKGSE